MERDERLKELNEKGKISIHTLRMERDLGIHVIYGELGDFNPHAPHGA